MGGVSDFDLSGTSVAAIILSQGGRLTMTNLLTYAALVGALIATPVSGTVLFDGGFDASTFPTKFDIVSYGSPFGASAAGGTASIEKLPTPGGVSGVTYIIPRLAVTGDFRQDVTFDFSSTVDPYQAVSIIQGLSVNFGGVENSDQLGAYINQYGIGGAWLQLYN